MGADQSRFGGSGTGTGAAQQSGEAPEDLYELLNVDAEATADEIKRGFRAQALRHHPDKNPGDVEAATRAFAKIQHAYEVLSDDDERAFYDRHRDAILAGDDEEDFDPTTATHDWSEPKSRRTTYAQGLTSSQLLKFLDPSLWSNNYTDSPSTAAFFPMFNGLFNRLAAEESSAAPLPGESHSDTPLHYPTFGTSQAKYEEFTMGQDGTTVPPTQHFYSSWSNFSTRKSFVWVEPIQLPPSATSDRRLRRYAEKENSKARDAARKEYNETVRTLVSFLKRRDPRWKTCDLANPEKLKKREQMRIEKELKESYRRKTKAREVMANQYEEQSWQKQQTHLVESSSEEEGESEEESQIQIEQGNCHFLDNDDEILLEWYCDACNKDFNSQGAWDNHVRSKKHKQNAFRLRKILLDEEGDQTQSIEQRQSVSMTQQDEDLALQLTLQESIDDLTLQEDEDEIDVDNAKQKGKKKQNRRKYTSLVEDVKPENVDESNQVDNSLSNSITTNEVEPSCRERSEVTTTTTTELLSKKEKRRLKEAKKKVDVLSTHHANGHAQVCNVCSSTFSSRSKLFDHIRTSGHALAERSSNPSSVNAEDDDDNKQSTGKGKRGRKKREIKVY